MTIKDIQQHLKSASDPETIKSISKFVPKAQKIYGVKNPVLNQLAKDYKGGGFELVEELWHAGVFEERVLAAKMLGKIAKADPDRALKMVKKFSREISDWAVCDTLGMQSLKPLVKNYADEIFSMAKEMNKSNNPWQRRLSLVLVEFFTRDKTRHTQIMSLVKPLKNDDEYYVKKAVDWILRNLKKGR